MKQILKIEKQKRKWAVLSYKPNKQWWVVAYFNENKRVEAEIYMEAMSAHFAELPYTPWYKRFMIKVRKCVA